MLEHVVGAVLEILIPVCEIIGIVVVAISALSAFWRYLRRLVSGDMGDIKFRLAAGLALSLEFKMAAEILKTVQIHDLGELTVLAIVIALRAVLSLLIHFEMRHKE